MNTGWFILWLLLTALLFWRIGFIHGVKTTTKIVKGMAEMVKEDRRRRR